MDLFARPCCEQRDGREQEHDDSEGDPGGTSLLHGNKSPVSGEAQEQAMLGTVLHL